MKTQYKIKLLFQVTALILTIIQLHQSFNKYLKYPIVLEKSRIPVENLPSPVIYICQDNQFNYTKARKFGYHDITHFMAGILMENTTVSWNGKIENLTFQDLEGLLYKHDYSTLDASHSMERIKLFPHGVCMKLTNVKPNDWLGIRTNHEVLFIVVDPAVENDLRTEETTEAKISIGPHSANQYEAATYEIEYTLHDASIHNGITCTDYSQIETSYRNCLDNMMQQALLSTYGCLPPWVPVHKSAMGCKPKTSITAKDIVKSKVYEVIRKLLQNKEVGIFKKCMPPCKTMQIKLKQVLYRTNRPEYAFIDTESKDWATVYTEVPSYDFFSLMVDIGSSLSLWMGLSCLGVLDHIFECFNTAENYWEKIW